MAAPNPEPPDSEENAPIARPEGDRAAERLGTVLGWLLFAVIVAGVVYLVLR